MDELGAAVDDVWNRRPDNVVADNQIPDNNTPRIRNYLSQLTEDQRKQRYVINDLFLTEAAIRRIALQPFLVSCVGVLMGTVPILAQSLNFRWGSNQGLHVDTLYLPPPTEGHIVAIWIAMEDILPESGPLTYTPGSHLIPPLRFEGGKLFLPVAEAGRWDNYIATEIASRDLKPETFCAKKGDVLIWHAQLAHGGRPVEDRNQTRKSLVCHFYSMHDAMRLGWGTSFDNGGFWWRRPPHPV